MDEQCFGDLVARRRAFRPERPKERCECIGPWGISIGRRIRTRVRWPWWRMWRKWKRSVEEDREETGVILSDDPWPLCPDRNNQRKCDEAKGQNMQEDLREFKCLRCGHEWKVPFCGGRQMVCPKCNSQKIRRANPGIGGPWRGKRRGCYGRNRY